MPLICSDQTYESVLIEAAETVANLDAGFCALPANYTDDIKEVNMPKSTRNSGKRWTASQRQQLKSLARKNTPTRVIGLKLGRSENSVRSQAGKQRVSLKPTNRSPYGSRKR